MLPNGKLHPSVRHIAGTALFQYEVLHDGQSVVALTFNDSAMVIGSFQWQFWNCQTYNILWGSIGQCTKSSHYKFRS